jgi:hypothetical protein
MTIRKYFPKILEPKLESEFLDFGMHRQRDLALWGVYIFNAFSLIFIVLDVFSQQTISADKFVINLRLIFLTVSIFLVYLIKKAKSNSSYTAFVVLFVFIAILFNSSIQLTRQANELLAIAIDMIFLLSIYLFFRIELKYETILASLLAISVILITTFHREMLFVEFLRAVFAVSAANIVGFLMANHWQYVERKMFVAKKEEEILKEKYQKSLESVKTLTGLIPICSSCNKIKDDNGYWLQVEHYIASHTEAQMSHSVCRSCIKELYGEDTLQEVIKASDSDTD